MVVVKYDKETIVLLGTVRSHMYVWMQYLITNMLTNMITLSSINSHNDYHTEFKNPFIPRMLNGLVPTEKTDYHV